MSRAPFFALVLLAGCGKGTTLLLDVQGSAPAGLHLNVWGPSGRIGGTDLESPGQPPGRLRLAGLPGKDQTIRIAFMNGKFGPPVGALRLAVRAEQESEAQVKLDTFALTDRDDDRVPEEIDNCPLDRNFEQGDSDENGAGDACPNMTPPDLLMQPDMTGDGGTQPDMVCAGRFCDDFETDSVAVGGATIISSEAPTTRWLLDNIGDTTPAPVTTIDTMGALGSSRSIKFEATATTTSGRPLPYIQLYPGLPTIAAIFKSPMYIRFFVRTSQPPSVFNGGATSTGTIFWDGSNIGSGVNLTLEIQNGGIYWNPRFDNGAAVTEPSVTTPWSGDWICVEWRNENTQGAAPRTYSGSVTIQRPTDSAPVNAGTITSTSTPVLADFGALVFGPDLDLRLGTGPTTYAMWFDEIIIDDKPIGCTRRR
jgi:hypothetical protein